MAADSSALLRPPLAYVQSPSYSKDDQEQGGSIEDAPDLVPPEEPPYTPTDPGTEASCLERYQYNLGTCYAGALAEVNEERRTLVNACYADHQGAIDAAMAAVEEAEKDVVAMQKGLYQPAEPLILTLPVAHCRASSYAVEDQVLIDFPEREPGATGMGVWNSARVIGWASNPQRCLKWSVTYGQSAESYPDFYEYPHAGQPWQSVYDGEDASPFTTYDTTGYARDPSTSTGLYATSVSVRIHLSGTEIYKTITDKILCSTPTDVMFKVWSDGVGSRTRQETNVTKHIRVTAYYVSYPKKMYALIDWDQDGNITGTGGLEPLCNNLFSVSPLNNTREIYDRTAGVTKFWYQMKAEGWEMSYVDNPRTWYPFKAHIYDESAGYYDPSNGWICSGGDGQKTLTNMADPSRTVTYTNTGVIINMFPEIEHFREYYEYVKSAWTA